jgi:hypothetical protein
MFSETSGLNAATAAPEDIRHCYRRENIPEDSALQHPLDATITYNGVTLTKFARLYLLTASSASRFRNLH